MADDFDNTDEIRNLSDDELREYVRTELLAQKTIDANDVTVQVKNGAVTVAGRVGTEEELRILDHVLTDLIGVTTLDNQTVVESIRRAESPEAIDEHLAHLEEREGLMLGDIPRPLSPETEHLVDDRDDVEEKMGTRDVQEAIEAGEPWIPPDSPTPEGVSGQDQGNFGIDGRH